MWNRAEKETEKRIDPSVEKLVCEIIKESIIKAISDKKCKCISIKLLLEESHLCLAMENCGEDFNQFEVSSKDECAYEIISSFGGKIMVEHYKERGTVVSLKIPSFIHS